MMKLINIRAAIIDDDEAVCRRLASWLVEADYDVVTFSALEPAVEHLRRAACHVALLDWRLPEISGEAALAALLDAAPRVRPIVLTAFPESRDVIAMMRSGARDVLEKPIQQPALLDALQRQLAPIGAAARSEQEFNRWLGGRVRERRSRRGLTLAEAADASGLTSAQLSQIELGHSATTTWTLARICHALGTSLPGLFSQA